jgi:putative peptide maturation dehydrogenase
VSGNPTGAARRRWVRRPAPCVIEVGDQPWVDVAALLRGELQPRPVPAVQARALLQDATHELSAEEAALLASCTQGAWTEVTAAMPDGAIARLAELGLLQACDGEAAPPPPDEPVPDWFPAAAHYHFASRWQGVLARDDLPADAPSAQGIYAQSAAGFEAQARQGPAPDAFPRRGDVARQVALPRPAPGTLDALLERRETHRLFDPQREVSRQDLGAILHRSLAARAGAAMGGGLLALRKAMPSGGGLHPVEAYPLVARVEGMTPGWYHYRAAEHALAPVAALPLARVRELIVALTAGQAYYVDAPLLVFLALRFPRHHWKYPRHAKAYRVMLLDVGHAGQAFALAVAERGLGAFFTAAINEADADAALGLDGVTEGVVAAMGCGHPAPGGEVLRLSHYASALREDGEAG